MNAILILKALHVIGFVSWFAGLFYLVRLFVYDVEANDKPEPEKSILKSAFNAMQWRVYKIICNPAMMITWTAGFAMIALNPDYMKLGWMHLKLGLLFLLLAYHIYSKVIIKKLEAGESVMSAFQLRLFNEVPSLFLAAIAFTAVLGKAGTLNYLYLGIGLALFAGLMYLGANAYRKKREKAGL
ncbi:MAG: CopD family protein [Saprospiraceae bacterium]